MKTSASILFLLFCLGSSAQTTEDYYVPAKPKITVKDRISGSVMAGTSVSFLNNSKNTLILISHLQMQRLTKMKALENC